MKTLDAASPTVKKLKNIRLSANKNMTASSATKRNTKIEIINWFIEYLTSMKKVLNKKITNLLTYLKDVYEIDYY